MMDSGPSASLMQPKMMQAWELGYMHTPSSIMPCSHTVLYIHCILLYVHTLPHLPHVFHSASGESLYKLLGLEKGASEEEIKRAYRKVC